MMSRLIGGRSIAGIFAAVAVAILVLISLSGWNFSGSTRADHWLLGQLMWSPIMSTIVAIIALVATSFVVRFQINRNSLSQARGSHHLILVPLFACLGSNIDSFFQVVAACIAAISMLMMINMAPQEKRADPVFHSGIVFGAAVILVPSFIWLSILLLALMIRVGKIAWRNWTALILGILFPFVVLITAALLFNFHEGLISGFGSSVKHSDFILDLPKLVVPVLLVIASVTGLFASYSPLTVRDKVTLQCFGIWLFGMTILIPVGLVDSGTALVCAAIPAAVLSTRWLEYVNRKWIVDLVYTAFIVGLLL